MSWINRVLWLSIQLCVVVFGLEYGSRLLFSDPKSRFVYDDSVYTASEKDRNLPFALPINGGECVKINLNRLNWNQWWGFSAKRLDISCAKKLLSDKELSIVFMGGSAMFNFEAPNYLTHIDFYATKKFNNFASINLAESGARHKNMSVRFQREVIPLKPSIVVFLDGFNEFNSIRYGGDPSDDFYWTAGVRARVHQPYRFYIDKLIEISKFAEVALVRTGLYTSARIGVGYKSPDMIERSAEQYLKDIAVTKVLCDGYNIKCLFVLQPQVFNSIEPEHQQIIDAANLQFPGYKEGNLHGYQYIKQRCDYCIDASDLLSNKKNTFIDPVHFGKDGSYLLGEFLYSLVRSQIKSAD
jgi:hypothetical protein